MNGRSKPHARTPLLLVRVAATGVLASAVVLACVGADPTDQSSSPDAGANADSSTSGGSSGNSSSGGNDAGSGTPDARQDAPGDAGGDVTNEGSDANADADAGVPVDAGPPNIVCTQQAIAGAYFFTRSASAATLTPGGTISTGNFVLARVWDGAGGSISGSATVFQDNGKLFLQWYILPNGGTARRGTKWIEMGANGAITLTELCESGKVGTVETGTYQFDTAANPDAFWINYGGSTPTLQHRWDLQ